MYSKGFMLLKQGHFWWWDKIYDFTKSLKLFKCHGIIGNSELIQKILDLSSLTVFAENKLNVIQKNAIFLWWEIITVWSGVFSTFTTTLSEDFFHSFLETK